MMLRPPIWGVIPNRSERKKKRPEWLSNMFGTGTTTCYIEVTKKAALFPQRGPSCERTQPVVRRHGSAAQRWDLVLPPVDPPTLTRSSTTSNGRFHSFPIKNGGSFHSFPIKNGGSFHSFPIKNGGSFHSFGCFSSSNGCYCWSYDYREKGFFSDSHADSWSWNGDVSKRYGWPNLVLDRAQSSRPQRK